MGEAAIDITTLTAEQKLELIDELWVSLAVDDLELTLEQRAGTRGLFFLRAPSSWSRRALPRT